jgi:hypothetical protein
MEVTGTRNGVADKVVRTCPHNVGTVVVSLPGPISDSVGWVDLRYIHDGGSYVLECASTGCVFVFVLDFFSHVSSPMSMSMFNAFYSYGIYTMT